MSIRTLLLVGAFAVGLVVLLLAATPSRSLPDRSRPVAPDTTKPLRPLMVGLAQDMDRIATGLWYEDFDLVREGASGIANHPKIPPPQMATIKEALGNQFKTFVQYDQRVHRTATRLVEAAEARQWSDVLARHEQLQRGCVNCHTAFRSRLRPVLRP